MDLYLHIGTEKTGSSYLQSLAAVNRDTLLKAGIFFPHGGKRDDDMLNGRISPGNARMFCKILENNAGTLITSWLKEKYDEANSNKCNKLLLSNEELVLALSRLEILTKLIQSSKDAGFTSLNFLLFLRDPVDQALSLYKHRAKSGNILPIKEWPERYYYYGDALYQFLSNVKKEDVSLNCRRYDNSPGVPENIFFQDWLNVEVPQKKVKSVINPSLTISELLMIRLLRERDPLLAKAFYDQMLQIPKEEKGSEGEIEAYYRYVLSNHLQQYQATWELCNEVLPATEQLNIPGYSNFKGSGDQVEKKLNFSEQQTKVVVDFMTEGRTGRLRRLKHRLRMNLSKFKRGVYKFTGLNHSY